MLGAAPSTSKGIPVTHALPPHLPGFVALPGAERDALLAFLLDCRPGAVEATGWVASKQAAIRKLRNPKIGLHPDNATRLDRLVATSARSKDAALPPRLWVAERERLAAYLDDVLDELAVAERIETVVARAGQERIAA